MTFPEFETFLKESFPEVSAEASERFRMMEAGYTEWNARINVISRKDISSLYDHHVLHSLAIAEYLRTRRPETYSSFLAPDNGTRILDLGTGGGFPGIPLAVMFPGARFTLCDSVGKKTIVAREISNMLGLGNVEIVNARAESLNEKFDFVVSRAVASLTDFSVGQGKIFTIHPLPQRRRDQRGDLRPDVPRAPPQRLHFHLADRQLAERPLLRRQIRGGHQPLDHSPDIGGNNP